MENHKSQVLADPQMVHPELWWDHVQSQTNSSGLQYFWTLFLPSLSCSLISESTALYYSCLATGSCVCVCKCCRAGGKMWEREREVQVLNSLYPCIALSIPLSYSLSELQMDVEYFSFQQQQSAGLSIEGAGEASVQPAIARYTQHFE